MRRGECEGDHVVAGVSELGLDEDVMDDDDKDEDDDNLADRPLTQENDT